MTIPSGSQPPAGSVGTGELYADAQSQLLWLGVPSSIAATQSVLVGDIVGTQQNIAQALADAMAFTTAGLAGKSNTGHTHVISDVTGLAAALAAANSVPAGMISIWSGNIISIPAGYSLCDGTNGTPDLRDLVVVGAGGAKAQLSTGGAVSKTVTSVLAGAHSHGGVTSAHTLTVAEMPSHAHSVSDPGHTHGGTTDAQGNHTHAIQSGAQGAGAFVGAAIRADLNNSPISTAAAGNHAHNLIVSGAFTGIGIVANGGGAGHTHPITSDAGHTHDVTVNVEQPYKVLAYVMKL